MLTPGGNPIRHNFHETAARIKLAVGKVVLARVEALDAMGVQAMSWGFIDYRVKSAGGTAQGIKWKPILQSTVDRRTRRLGTFKRLKTKAARDKALAKGRRFVRKDGTVATAKIGVDRGRLIGSMKFGHPDAIKRVGKFSVIVGTQVDYGVHFDKVRPVYGPGFIDQQRQAKLEAIAKRVYERVVKAGIS